MDLQRLNLNNVLARRQSYERPMVTLSLMFFPRWNWKILSQSKPCCLKVDGDCMVFNHITFVYSTASARSFTNLKTLFEMAPVRSSVCQWPRSYLPLIATTGIHSFERLLRAFRGHRVEKIANLFAWIVVMPPLMFYGLNMLLSCVEKLRIKRGKFFSKRGCIPDGSCS